MQSVFQLFKNPEVLTRYQPYTQTVEVKGKVEKPSLGSESIITEYILRGDTTLSLLFGIELTAVIDGNYSYMLSNALQSEDFMLSMDLKSSSLGITMDMDAVWTIAHTKEGETLLSEVLQLYPPPPPKIMASLVENTARCAHEIMLNSIKESAERDLKSEFMD